MEPATQDYAPAKPAGKKFGAKQAVIVIIVLLLLTGGVVYMTHKSSAPAVSISPTPTEAPTTMPSPEPTTASPSASPSKVVTPSSKPSPTRKAGVSSATDMNIQVLNGTGETGMAGTVRDYLKGKGYVYLETGNADNNNYKNMTVKVKSSLSQYGDTLKKDLSGKYTLASDSATLANDSTFDAVVIVGK